MQSATGLASLYTREIDHYIHTRKWPKNLRFTIGHDDFQLWFVLYRDNFNTFDGEDRLQIAMMVKEVMERVRSEGVPISLEVQKTPPPLKEGL